MNKDSFPFVLIGNKSDLEHQRTVDPQNVPKFMEEHPMTLHLQASAKDCEGVAEVFRKIAEVALLNKK